MTGACPYRRAVLGIDAAWTPAQPSGVALAAESDAEWQLLAVAASYRRFYVLGDARLVPEVRPTGSVADVPVLLAISEALCGRPVDLVAIDMPLSHVAITGRRAADDSVSRAYGARKCGTHTPSALRPGRISDELCEGFGRAGYPLLTTAIAPPGIIEVYPHPALVELASATERLPYKAGKIASYWPALRPDERRAELLRQWAAIVVRLDAEIAGVAAMLPAPEAVIRGAALKAYEDMLDAVVCAWVAICALDGRARCFGDGQSAIWIPLPAATAPIALAV